MKKTSLLVLVLSLGTFLTRSDQRALACARIGSGPVTVSGEEALVVWDAANHKEYFVRSAAFQSATPFAFLVPTPTRPTLRETDQQIFTRLFQLYSAPNTFRHGEGSAGGGGLRGARPSAAVTVVEETHVAGLDATVLQSNNAAALASWLRERNFSSDANLARWLRPYAEAGYFITAFRYVPQARAFMSQAVVMEFATDRPFFPYSEPEASRGLGRRFRVSVVAESRVRGVLQAHGDAHAASRPWVRPAFAQSNPNGGGIGIVGAVHRSVPAEAPCCPTYLTTFDLPASPRDQRDLFFEIDHDASPIASRISLRIGVPTSRGSLQPPSRDLVQADDL